jgi:hypothetical protein
VLRARSSSVAKQNDSPHMPGHTNPLGSTAPDADFYTTTTAVTRRRSRPWREDDERAEVTCGFRNGAARVIIFVVVRPVLLGRSHPVS